MKLKKVSSYFILPVLFYSLHLFLDFVFDVYVRFSWFDELMHFSGGIVLAFTFFPILNYLHREGDLKISRLIKFIFAISLVISVAVFWEFYEFVASYFFNLNWQPSVADTMSDLFLGMCGGVVAGLIFLLKE